MTRKNKILAVQRELASHGMEKRPDEIWNQVFNDAEGREDMAEALLEALLANDLAFEYFSMLIHVEKQTTFALQGFSKQDLIMSFLLGSMFTLLLLLMYNFLDKLS